MSIPLNIDIQQILLHLFNFAILAAGLYILLYKPVKNFMDKRIAYYKEMDDKAEEKLSKAEGLRNAYQKQVDETDDIIREQKNRAAKEAKALADAEIEAAHRQSAEILKKAQEDAQVEKDRMIASARQEIVDLAVLATQKLMEESLKNTEGDGAHEG